MCFIKILFENNDYIALISSKHESNWFSISTNIQLDLHNIGIPVMSCPNETTIAFTDHDTPIYFLKDKIFLLCGHKQTTNTCI